MNLPNDIFVVLFVLAICVLGGWVRASMGLGPNDEPKD